MLQDNSSYVHIYFTTYIPVDLCAYVLKEKLVRPFELYMHLKLISCGTIHKSDPRFKILKQEVYNRETFRRNLQVLIKLNWIGYNKQTGIYFIRSYHYLRKQIGSKKNLRVLFHKEDFTNFKEFLFASIVGVDIQRQIWRKRYQAEQNESSSNQPDNAPPFSYYGMGINRMSFLTGYSTGQCHTLKKTACSAGYLNAKNRYHNTNVHRKYLNQYKKANPKLANKLWPYKGYIFIQLHDEISHNLKYSKRGVNYHQSL